MQLHILDSRLWFPPVEDAMEDGLLAIGGDLSTERLQLAYRQGFFRGMMVMCRYGGAPIPALSSTLAIAHKQKHEAVAKSTKFRFTINTAFEQVIKQCML